MNIDLRNVSERFEENVNKVKKLHRYNTNTSVVEHCVCNFLRIEEENREIKEELRIAKLTINRYKTKIGNFREAFKDLIN
jgi:hypothetical protein